MIEWNNVINNLKHNSLAQIEGMENHNNDNKMENDIFKGYTKFQNQLSKNNNNVDEKDFLIDLLNKKQESANSKCHIQNAAFNELQISNQHNIGTMQKLIEDKKNLIEKNSILNRKIQDDLINFQNAIKNLKSQNIQLNETCSQFELKIDVLTCENIEKEQELQKIRNEWMENLENQKMIQSENKINMEKLKSKLNIVTNEEHDLRMKLNTDKKQYDNHLNIIFQEKNKLHEDNQIILEEAEIVETKNQNLEKKCQQMGIQIVQYEKQSQLEALKTSQLKQHYEKVTESQRNEILKQNQILQKHIEKTNEKNTISKNEIIRQKNNINTLHQNLKEKENFISDIYLENKKREKQILDGKKYIDVLHVNFENLKQKFNFQMLDIGTEFPANEKEDQNIILNAENSIVFEQHFDDEKNVKEEKQNVEESIEIAPHFPSVVVATEINDEKVFDFENVTSLSLNSNHSAIQEKLQKLKDLRNSLESMKE